MVKGNKGRNELMAQCSAKTKNGVPCRNSTGEGQKFCHIHRRQNFLYRIFSISAIAVVLAALGFVADITGILGYFDIKPYVSASPTFTPFESGMTSIPVEILVTETLAETPTSTFAFSPTSINTFTSSPTPTVTFTPTPTLNPVIFKGFDRNCIDPDYWTPHVYPGESTPEPNSCLDLSTRGFNSQDGGLRVSIHNVPYSVFSISTELPSKDFEIHFKLNFESFTSKSSDTAAILIFGVGPSDDWILKDGNYLTYSILQGNTTNEVLEQIGTNKLKPDYLLHRFFPPREIDVRIVIKGIDMLMFVDNATYGFFPVSLSKPGSRDNFWIGYQLPANQSTVKVTVSEFTITETK